MCFQKIKIPVNKSNGIGLLNYIYFHGAEIPKGLVEITNSYASEIITDMRDNPILITITKPLNVKLINENEVNIFDQPDEDIYFQYQEFDKKGKENLKNLRLKHCNREEYQAIRNLCYEYRYSLLY